MTIVETRAITGGVDTHADTHVAAALDSGRVDKPEKEDGWAQRALAEPRLGLAMLIGALGGIPGRLPA